MCKIMNYEKDFKTKDIKPQSDLNNFLYALDTSLSGMLTRGGYKFELWKKYYEDKKVPYSVVIEFRGDRGAVDWLDIAFKRLKQSFCFEANFINPSNHELEPSYKSSGVLCMGRLYIELKKGGKDEKHR